MIPLPECDPNSELSRQQKMIAEIPNHLGIPKEYLERITRVSTFQNAYKGISSVSISINFSDLEKYTMADAGQMYFDCGGRQLPVDRSTRRMFAYVPQGNLLFSGSIRENLLIAKPDATEEQIRHATYISAMDEYLEQLPNGLDTVLGESGAGLSEGQAQRLALGRAVLCDAPILLLDESTSALDPQTERTVLERICGLRDRSCIAVTHRPAAVELFDWHIEIDKNQVRLHKNR